MTRRALLEFLPAFLVPRHFKECGRPAQNGVLGHWGTKKNGDRQDARSTVARASCPEPSLPNQKSVNERDWASTACDTSAKPTRQHPTPNPPHGARDESIPSPDSNSLDAWLRLPLRPILNANLLALADQAIASRLLEMLPLGQSFEFIYQGGSEPGSRRRVLPVLLFQKSDPELPATNTQTSPTYLLAFCQSRNAPRTFRLDRIQPHASPCSGAL